MLLLGKGGTSRVRQGTAAPRPARFFFCLKSFGRFLLYSGPAPACSRCRHLNGLVVAIRMHRSRGLELKFKPCLGQFSCFQRWPEAHENSNFPSDLQFRNRSCQPRMCRILKRPRKNCRVNVGSRLLASGLRAATSVRSAAGC